MITAKCSIWDYMVNILLWTVCHWFYCYCVLCVLLEYIYIFNFVQKSAPDNPRKANGFRPATRDGSLLTKIPPLWQINDICVSYKFTVYSYISWIKRERVFVRGEGGGDWHGLLDQPRKKPLKVGFLDFFAKFFILNHLVDWLNLILNILRHLLNIPPPKKNPGRVKLKKSFCQPCPSLLLV